MESTAINSIYVVYATAEYTSVTVTYMRRAFFREDDARKYVEKMQKMSDETCPDYVVEYWDYKEIDIM